MSANVLLITYFIVLHTESTYSESTYTKLHKIVRYLLK